MHGQRKARRVAISPGLQPLRRRAPHSLDLLAKTQVTFVGGLPIAAPGDKPQPRQPLREQVRGRQPAGLHVISLNRGN